MPSGLSSSVWVYGPTRQMRKSFVSSEYDISPGSAVSASQLTLSPSVSQTPLTQAFLRILGSTPTDLIAMAYKKRAEEVALISRDADSMPRVPVSIGQEEQGQELDVVTAARKAAAAVGRDGGDAEGENEKVYVQGRDVSVEWIWRVAVGDVRPEELC